MQKASAWKLAATLIATLVMATPPASALTLSNTSHGYVLFGTLEPSAMTGFKWDFSSGDHHIHYVSTGSSYVDTQWGRLLLAPIAFNDNCGNDVYSWQYSFRPLPAGSIIKETSGTTRGTRTIMVDYNVGGYEPVLLGFSYSYRSDHHLTGLSIDLTADGGNIWLDTGFWENGSDEDYSYQITYALVPATALRYNANTATFLFSASGSARGYAATPLSAARPVLQAFRMQFTNGDHHVDEVGVDLTPAQARIWYNDTNDDDPFYWNVRYVDFLQ